MESGKTQNLYFYFDSGNAFVKIAPQPENKL
jgi:hypothetical protein